MYFHIQTPTPDLAKSLDFYSRLKFTRPDEDANSFCDGPYVIEINADRFARAGIKLFGPMSIEKISELENFGKIVEISNGRLIAAPSGTWVYFGEENIPALNQCNASQLGTVAGLSLESIDMGRSIAFWKTLGFKEIMGGEDKGWVALQNEYNQGISIMKPHACPHLFFNPSITYFNSEKNLEVINQLREMKIELTEEITSFNPEGQVDNVVLRDPGGLGFFVFSD